MAKMTFGDVTIEGTPEELRDMIEKIQATQQEGERKSAHVEDAQHVVKSLKAADSPAKEGDVIVPIEHSVDLVEGKEYEVKERYGVPYIIDEAGDRRPMFVRSYNNYAIVKKGAPTIPESIEVDGAEYENLGCVDAVKGDYVMFVRDFRGTTAAKKYKVLEYGQYIDDAGASLHVDGWASGGRKNARVVFRKKGRLAQDGDTVRFTESHADITIGKEYKVSEDDCGSAMLIDDAGDERTYILQRRERHTYEILGEDYEKDFKKGDIVKHNRDWFNREGIGEIVGFSSLGTPQVKGVKAGGEERTFYMSPRKLTLIVSAENREDK
jgi:hypothetical protein